MYLYNILYIILTLKIIGTLKVNLNCPFLDLSFLFKTCVILVILISLSW